METVRLHSQRKTVLTTHLQLYSYLEVSEYHSCLQLSSLMLSAHWTTSQGILTFLLTGDRHSWTLRVEAALLVMTLPSLFRLAGTTTNWLRKSLRTQLLLRDQ